MITLVLFSYKEHQADIWKWTSEKWNDKLFTEFLFQNNLEINKKEFIYLLKENIKPKNRNNCDYNKFNN